MIAVPIDIGAVHAKLVFDVARREAHGSATVHFHAGAKSGYPVFDLRQPIAAANLDGMKLRPADLELVRFGVKNEQSLRVLRKQVKAGSAHRLHLDYRIANPPLRASSMGGYQPELRWGPGGTIDFNFGFTDLGGGRYLEAWAPANLIHDRFAIGFDVHVRGTKIEHVLISNGTVEETGRNRWRVQCPPTFTALSPMLQLHPRESVEQACASATLPVSRRRISIEAWKFRADPVNLAAQLDTIARCLRRNEETIGPYHHGSRFTAFIHIGGMEYDGACTAEPDALEHEVFHSWWARGVKPASQNDGWIDEAWTVYHDHGGEGARAFDFQEPPVRLSAGTPWNRATPIAAYRQGARFFEGLGARIGVDRLHAIMREIYALHAPGLISTAQIEAHFLDRTAGDRTIARAFDRWVYGRAR